MPCPRLLRTFGWLLEAPSSPTGNLLSPRAGQRSQTGMAEGLPPGGVARQEHMLNHRHL